VKDPEDLVFGAELWCQYGNMHNYLLTENYAIKGINGLPAKFVVTDCVPGVNIMPFGDCLAGGPCMSQWKLDDKWTNSSGQNETFGGKEIITTASHLVCDAWGMLIRPENSGQNTDIGKQLMLLSELDGDLLAFLMNPYNSIYTPNDISQKVLDLLGQIVNSDLYNGEIFLMAQGNYDIMGPIILACMGHLEPSIGVGDPNSMLTGMECMLVRTGIQTNADPRYLNAEMLDILKADSQWYSEKVANGGFYKWQEENKLLLSFLADVVTTAAYAAIMYSSMYAGRGNPSYYDSNPDVIDGEIGQANRSAGGGADNNPLSDVQYTDKVKAQMSNSSDLYHSYPSLIDEMALPSDQSTIVGRDGVSRTLIQMPGSINGAPGVFEYIIDADGVCNHRLFRPY